MQSIKSSDQSFKLSSAFESESAWRDVKSLVSAFWTLRMTQGRLTDACKIRITVIYAGWNNIINDLHIGYYSTQFTDIKK